MHGSRLMGMLGLWLLTGAGAWAADPWSGGIEKPYDPPYHVMDLERDGQLGTGALRAHDTLNLQPPTDPIIVAVIDSGVQVDHPEFAGRIWTNAAEAAGTDGVDDDGNGYVDDVHGWNFIGHADGTQNLYHARMEILREQLRLQALADAGTLPAEDRPRLQQLTWRVEQTIQRARQLYMRAYSMQAMTDRILDDLRADGFAADSIEAALAVTSDDPLVQARLEMLGMLADSRGMSQEMLSYAESELGYHYNPAWDESAIIGDDPDVLDELGYGNPRVSHGDHDYHGTHCAGIIGARRDDRLGTEGQAPWVRIMVLRVVPDGDERDKDVANAVRYAVDNGAQIISMSFGKPISPHKPYVDDAFRHAAAQGVLVVHGAGNSGMNVDQNPTYPNPILQSPGPDEDPVLENWLVVGATGPQVGPRMVADFSNYGSQHVHLFAPGVDIYSTTPGGTYNHASGTSMACPQVAGVAALVWSQHPQLTNMQVRALLMDSARRFPNQRVHRPGDGQLVPFASLSASGGVVDAYAALQLAAERYPVEQPQPTEATSAP